jgi:putative chitinase
VVAAATSTPTASVPVGAQFPFTFNYTVQRNETVAVLAVRFGSSVEAIAQANGLNSDYLIFVGQQLVIPVATAPVTPSSTPAQIIVTATPAQAVAPLGSNSVYIVLPGDSLTRIARLFNTTIGALAQLNGIVNPNQIQVGQRLLIPAVGTGGGLPTATVVVGVPATATPSSGIMPTMTPSVSVGVQYVVQPGDSLYTISIRFGVPIYRIAQANNIRNTWLIYAGQRLIIP